MASHAYDFGRASALPLSAVLASIPSYPRPVIERLVSRLIDHLDEQDGDADAEECDRFGLHPDDEDDDPGEVSWPERHSAYALSFAIPVGMLNANEDDEDGHDAEREEACR